MSLELHDAHEFAWLTAPIRYTAAQDLHPRLKSLVVPRGASPPWKFAGHACSGSPHGRIQGSAVSSTAATPGSHVCLRGNGLQHQVSRPGDPPRVPGWTACSRPAAERGVPQTWTSRGFAWITRRVPRGRASSARAAHGQFRGVVRHGVQCLLLWGRPLQVPALAAQHRRSE